MASFFGVPWLLRLLSETNSSCIWVCNSGKACNSFNDVGPVLASTGAFTMILDFDRGIVGLYKLVTEQIVRLRPVTILCPERH